MTNDTALVTKVAKMLYNATNQNCNACHGRGYVTYVDDDAYDVQPCECKL